MSDPVRAAGAAPWVRAVVLGLALVALMTAPTITRPTSVGRVDTNDGRFSIWNVAWISHAILSPDDRVLDANIFSPHTGTLAYSELNLVAGLFGLPFYLVTGDPVAALNGSIFVALVLAFVWMAALVRHLTGSEAAGLVAATAYTFCPYASARTAHVQLLMFFVFPVLLLALHRLTEAPSAGRGVVLGVVLAVAALACGYYGLFGGLALGLMGLALARRAPRYWAGLAAAATVAGGLVYPVFRAFQQARELSGAELRPQTDDDARVYSANISAWLASGAFAHEWWLPRLAAWQPWKDVLFPGAVLLILTAAGVWSSLSRPSSRRVGVAYLALVFAAVWASFGPDAGLYSLLHATVPGMSLLRAPARLGILAVFAMAVLAGFAVAHWSQRRRWLPVVLVLLLVGELGVKTAEWGWPSWPLKTVPPVSAAYRRLAELPRGVLVEFQFPYVSSNYHNHAKAMFWSAYHWQPLVNGYSDVIPPDFHEIALPINGFPDPESFAIMRARQVRYVLWHADDYRGRPLEIVSERIARYEEQLKPIMRTPDIWLYEIVKWP